MALETNLVAVALRFLVGADHRACKRQHADLRIVHEHAREHDDLLHV